MGKRDGGGREKGRGGKEMGKGEREGRGGEIEQMRRGGEVGERESGR